MMLGMAKVVFSILLSGMMAIGRTMESRRRGYGASSGEGTRFKALNKSERHSCNRAGVMVSARIVVGCRTVLRVFCPSSLTAAIYQDVILELHVRPYMAAMVLDVMLMDMQDYIRVRLVNQCVERDTLHLFLFCEQSFLKCW
ncbi:hypothetical protein TNCV_4639611 [Trichonephila clavipes]|nr:hypothetical protein TNCV_4639611 [Trichonephila clavipes]